MASTKPGNPLAGSAYRSCGRGFAAVDPERQREVDVVPRLVTKPAPAAKARRAANPWFVPPGAFGEEGGSCRHSR